MPSFRSFVQPSLPADSSGSPTKFGFSAFRSLLAVLFVALLLCSAIASAQVETGQISGTVMDQSSAVIPGATVMVKNLGTNAVRSAVTSNNGVYVVTGLAPATYQVSINTGNFKPFVVRAEVTPGGRVSLDAKLSINEAVTQVEVIGEGGAQVNTQTQEISQVVNIKQVAQLPSLTRNPYDFVEIAGNISNGDAGSSGSGTGGQLNGQNSTTRGVGFNINGQRSTGTEILLDGVENVSVFGDGIGILIPLDSMQEYTVNTSNFLPQYGRASGGVVNVTTKSGSNAFHGNAWEYNRLSAYTANTETNDQIGAPKGTYTRNQFGFDVGGPVLKDKLFFFGSGEWLRVRSAAVLESLIPTSQFLSQANANIQSFFSAYGKNAPTKFTTTYTGKDVYGVDASGNCNLPQAGFDCTKPMFGLVNFNAPANAGGSIPQNTYNYVLRGDYNPSDKTQMYFRFADYKEVDQPGGYFASPYSQYNVGQTENNQAYLLSVSHEFTPALASNTKLAFSRFNTFQSFDTSLQNVPTLDVGTNATFKGIYIQLPGFFDTNPANGGLPYGGPQNTSQINEDLSWVKSKHSMQFGTQLVYIQDNNAYGAYAQAVEQLGNTKAIGLQNLATGNLFMFEAAVNPKGALPCVKDPYTGTMTQTAACSINLPATSPSFARSERFKDWAVYGQDSWKLTPRFTGNYGIRYEYYGVQHNDNQNLDSNFYYGTGSNIAQKMRSGQVYTVPNSPIHSLWNPTKGAISPRVGFAYDVFGNGRDSIRGGFGIAYERNFGNVTFNVIQNPPNYAVVVVNNTTVTNSNAGPLAGTSGSVPLPPTSLRHVDQNIKTAQTQFWSLAVEHQITHNTVASIQYVGAHGVHLYDIKNYNGLGSGNYALGDSYTDPQGRKDAKGNVLTALTRLNPQYSNINNRGSNGASQYQGLNVQFQTTNLRQSGLSLTTNYTWSHATDNSSTTFSETNNAFSLGYTNPFNPSLDWGNGDLDVRHRFVVAPIYAEPFFKDQRNLLGEALGGWNLSGIYVVHTGTPFTYFDFTNNATNYNVARYSTKQAVTQHTFKSIPSGVSGQGSNLYNIGKLPSAISWGNPALGGISDWGPWPTYMTSRNAFRGPGFWNFDVAMSKTFPIREGKTLEFRAEGFNIFNHHNLFLQEVNNDVSSNSVTDSTGNVFPLVQASKGGVGNGSGAQDERRYGQFALRLNF